MPVLSPLTIHLAAGFGVVALWWAGTALVLAVVRGQSAGARRTANVGSALLGALALLGLWALRDQASLAAVAASFACGVALWGAHEVLFLNGAVVGGAPASPPADARGWRRFALAARAIAHHEAALILTALLALALVWSGANGAGALAFAILWAMRLSAKLNVFFGVRNLAAEFLPPRVAHLAGFFKRAPANPFFPVSVGLGLAATWFLAEKAHSAADPSAMAAWSLATVLCALGVLEHAFLVLPIPDMPLWRWARPEGESDDVAEDRAAANTSGTASRAMERRATDGRIRKYDGDAAMLPPSMPAEG